MPARIDLRVLLCACLLCAVAAAADSDGDDRYAARIPTMSIETLCSMRTRPALAARVDAELQRRKAFGAAEWAQIKTGKVAIGMRAQVLRCSLGSPLKINRTVFAGGAREQWVYGGDSYAYIVNGRLEAWQD